MAIDATNKRVDLDIMSFGKQKTTSLRSMRQLTTGAVDDAG